MNRTVEFFKGLGLEGRIKVMEESTFTVEDAANALGVEYKDIAKSLTFKGKDKAILVVMAGDKKIDSKKYRKLFKLSSKMLDSDDVIRLTGYQIGGVSPFNLVSDDIMVYLDESLQGNSLLYVGAGASNTLVELSLEELERYSNYLEYIDISK